MLKAVLLYPVDDDVFALLDNIEFGCTANYHGNRLCPRLCAPSPNFFKYDISGHRIKEMEKGFCSRDFVVPQRGSIQLPFFNLILSTMYGTQTKVKKKVRVIQNLSVVPRGTVSIPPLRVFPRSRPGVLRFLRAPVPPVLPFSINDNSARIRTDKWRSFAVAVEMMRASGPHCNFIGFDIESAYKLIAYHVQDWHLNGSAIPLSEHRGIKRFGCTELRDQERLRIS